MVMVTQQCFQQIKNSDPNPADYWVVMQQLSALSVSNESRANLAKHIGPDSHYPQKIIAVNQLGAILAALDRYPSGSRKDELQKILQRAFMEKSPKALHLHFNLLMLLTFDRPNSIDAFLQRLRLETLSTLVNQHTQDLLEWDAFANAALCYGVQPLLKHSSSVHLLEAKKQKDLCEAFEKKYPEDIIGDLFNCIRREIGIYYGYVGEKAQGFGSADCQNIKAFLEQLLGASIEHSDLFKCYANRPIDINWLFIHKALCLKLSQGDQPYLVFSTEEKQLLDIIHNPISQNVSLDTLESLISATPGVFASYAYILYSPVLPFMLVDIGMTPVQQNNLLQMANSYPLERSENIYRAWVTANQNQITTDPNALTPPIQFEFLTGLRMLPSSKLQILFSSLSNPDSLFFLAAKKEPALLGELLKILPEQSSHVLKGLLVTLLKNNPQALIPILEVVATSHPTIQLSLLGDSSFLDKLLMHGSRDAFACLLNVLATHPADSQATVLCSQKNKLPLLLKIMLHYPSLLGTFLRGMGKLVPSVQMRLWMEFCAGEIQTLGKFPLSPLVLAARSVDGPTLVSRILKEIQTLCDSLTPVEKNALLRNLWLMEGITIADQEATYTPLMIALQNSQGLVLNELFKGMASLSEKLRNEIFCATTGGETNNNVLGILVLCPHSLLHCDNLLAAIGSLDSLSQIKLWGHRNVKGLRPLEIMEKKLPVQRAALRRTHGFEFSRCVALLSGTVRLEMARERAIQRAISAVSIAEDTPLEAVIGWCLRSMTVNAEDKKIAILIAILTMKNPDQNDLEEKIADDAFNPQSQLYLAVNRQRFFPLSRSHTLRELQQAIENTGRKNIKVEDASFFGCVALSNP